MESNAQVEQSQGKTMGVVKWFNNRSGFGFITVINGPRVDEDIFVHHTSLETKEDLYRYLVEGEYVELSIVKTSDDKHKWKAGNVTGVCGRFLMCETRKNSSEEQGREKEKKKN